ncbi:MAG: beta-N-acetylhexosaminidase [Pseudomonadota bacterium]
MTSTDGGARTAETPVPCTATILGCAGPELSEDERAFFADAQPWGFILFARNVESKDQLHALTTALRESVGWNAPILIDQEGGRVARLKPPTWRDWEPVGTLAQRLGNGSPEALWEALMLRYRLIGGELREVGIDVNCMPLLDVQVPGAHDIVGDRGLSESPEQVAERGTVICEALRSVGVLPVIKHLPGHGRATADSHLSLPVVDAPRDELEALDFEPFRALRHEALGMTAHIVYSALDQEACATQSETVIKQIIRGAIGFDGLLMSDDLSMKALDGSMAERTRRSIDAGCDVVLHCNGDLLEMIDVVDAAGQLSPMGHARANRALEGRDQPETLDFDAADAQLAALMEGKPFDEARL